MTNYSGKLAGAAKRSARQAYVGLADAYWTLRGLSERHGQAPEIQVARATSSTVDQYWGAHTVRSKQFRSATQSLNYLEWRFAEYPLFREFMQLYGKHEGEVILDYGCGPGNDVVGFAVNTQARKIIGMDVSRKALELTGQRLALHCVPPEKVQLIQVGDVGSAVPLENGSVDYLLSGGVLHHTSTPDRILCDLHRVLRPGATAHIMVYNYDSIYVHLYVAYMRMVLNGEFEGLDIRQAFTRCTDGPDCPVSRCYQHSEWLALCTQAGFEAEYAGGYLYRFELNCMQRYLTQAIQDVRLGEEHRAFLQGLTWDDKGFPMHKSYHAGIGGVYRLRKP